MMGAIWPYLAALLVGVAVIAAVPAIPRSCFDGRR